ASMHEVLTTAAAIRSTAAILADDEPIEPRWLNRFHDNLNADSRRLAESAKALVQYFDEETERGLVNLTPEDEFDAFWDAHFRDLSDVEAGHVTVDDLIVQAAQLRSDRSRELARVALRRVQSDAKALPRSDLAKAVFECGPDPLAISRSCHVRPLVVMRRLSLLADLEAGLVMCDRSGKLLLRQQSRNFQVPRFATPPADWALYDALAVPGQILTRPFQDANDPARDLVCFATAEISEADGYNRAPLIEATMLVVPADGTAVASA
ncbi:MAG: transcriptional regulator, partial [Pseudomonadota bacterium]